MSANNCTPIDAKVTEDDPDAVEVTTDAYGTVSIDPTDPDAFIVTTRESA